MKKSAWLASLILLFIFTTARGADKAPPSPKQFAWTLPVGTEFEFSDDLKMEGMQLSSGKFALMVMFRNGKQFRSFHGIVNGQRKRCEIDLFTSKNLGFKMTLKGPLKAIVRSVKYDTKYFDTDYEGMEYGVELSGPDYPEGLTHEGFIHCKAGLISELAAIKITDVTKNLGAKMNLPAQAHLEAVETRTNSCYGKMSGELLGRRFAFDHALSFSRKENGDVIAYFRGTGLEGDLGEVATATYHCQNGPCASVAAFLKEFKVCSKLKTSDAEGLRYGRLKGGTDSQKAPASQHSPSK